MRLLLTLLLVWLPVQAWAQPPVSSEHWTRRYDHYFRKYAKRYFGPAMDWHWFKAQAITESTLNEHAHNRSGAVGLMQLMPATFKEIRERHGHLGDIRSPRWNIAAGIYYDHYLYRKPRWRPLEDPLRLYATFASYNAGYRRTVRAYEAAHKPLLFWLQLAPYLPQQTRNYVNKIILLRKGGRRHRSPRYKGISGRLYADSGAIQNP